MVLSKETGTPLSVLKKSEKEFVEKIKNFAEKEVSPLVTQMDEQGFADQELLNKLFDNNLMSLEIPQNYGGRGLTLFESVLAIEEISKVDPAIGVIVDVHNTLVVSALNKYGSDEQKALYFPRLATGSLGAFSLSEKDAGSDAYALTCEAVPCEGGFTLNGTKHWVTNGMEAEIFILFANVNRSGKSKRLTTFIIDTQKIEGIKRINRENKMGIRASSTCELVLNDVFVPEDAVLGKVGFGQRVALEVLTESRVGIAAQMLGLASGAYKVAADYSKERVQFGNPISSYQGISFPLAEMATEIEAARLLIYNAARIKVAGEDYDQLFLYANMAKHFASKTAEKVASGAVDIMGGRGYVKPFAAEKFYRDVKIGKIYEGTTNMLLRSISQQLMRS